MQVSKSGYKPVHTRARAVAVDIRGACLERRGRAVLAMRVLVQRARRRHPAPFACVRSALLAVCVADVGSQHLILTRVTRDGRVRHARLDHGGVGGEGVENVVEEVSAVAPPCT